MRAPTSNLTDPDGTTALVVAIINAHYDLAAVLLEKGADPNVGDVDRDDTAVRGGRPQHAFPIRPAGRHRSPPASSTRSTSSRRCSPTARTRTRG